MTEEDNEDFKNSKKCWSVILMLKLEIIVILLKNMEVLHIETVLSILNKITSFLSYFTTLKIIIHILLSKN